MMYVLTERVKECQGTRTGDASDGKKGNHVAMQWITQTAETAEIGVRLGFLLTCSPFILRWIGQEIWILGDPQQDTVSFLQTELSHDYLDAKGRLPSLPPKQNMLE